MSRGQSQKRKKRIRWLTEASSSNSPINDVHGLSDELKRMYAYLASVYLLEQQSGTDSPAVVTGPVIGELGTWQRLTLDPIEVIAAHAAGGPTETCGITLTYWHGQ